MFPFTTDFATPQRSPFAFGAGMDGMNPGTPPVKPQPAMPVGPPAPAHGFDMNTFLQFLMGQMGQNQTPPPVDLGAQLSGVKKAQDPQGQANKGYTPGVNNAYNPFSNGFFNTR